jgi:SAM-dependent methyltransferase
MENLSPEFWSERYKTSNTGWDLGVISPPIKEYIDQLEDKSIRILIPGCGNAYEAEYLHQLGFTNIHVLDFASEPLRDLIKRVPDFPENHLHQDDFFAHKAQYDLVIEQTLFCAIDPQLRGDYIKTVKGLLAPKGKLVGLLFNRNFEGGPPFGGNKEEYGKLFSKEFTTVNMEDCYNSVAPRMGSELFVQMQKI